MNSFSAPPLKTVNIAATVTFYIVLQEICKVHKSSKDHKMNSVYSSSSLKIINNFSNLVSPSSLYYLFSGIFNSNYRTMFYFPNKYLAMPFLNTAIQWHLAFLESSHDQPILSSLSQTPLLVVGFLVQKVHLFFIQLLCLYGLLFLQFFSKLQLGCCCCCLSD